MLTAYMRKAVDTIAASTDDPEVDDADFHFHDTLLRASGSQALAFFANALGGVLHQAPHERRIEMRKFAGDRDIMVRLHRGIYDAVASGDPAAAASAVDEHFAAYDQLANAAHGSTALSGACGRTTRCNTTRASGDVLSPD